MAPPSADEALLPAEPMNASPITATPDLGNGGVQNEPEVRQADPVGDALRIVTPFGPAAQIPSDAAGGIASTGLPLPGGSGVMPGRGSDLQRVWTAGKASVSRTMRAHRF
jgi:hypothetical protein